MGRGGPTQLLPLVYDELRKLAAQKLAQEKPGQTLQATALVHEAYLRLVDVEKAQHWDSRGHFFAAAAEAMRRVLIDNARRRLSQRRGAGTERRTLEGLVQGQDLPRRPAGAEGVEIGVLAPQATAVLLSPLAAGVLDEDAAQGLGGGGE